MPKILIIEDETSIRDELIILLRNNGYVTEAITSFEDIISQISAADPDLILLDIGLPGQDGYSICIEIRKSTDIPIIFVTSRNSSMNELKAFNLGGDDFISKPYDLSVLLARIQAILRRSSRDESENITAGGLTLLLSKGEMEAGGKKIDLSKNETKILACLMKRPGEIVSRTELIEFLWDNQAYIDDNTLSVNMTRLRNKLAQIGLPDYISTKRGQGYKI